MLIRFIAAAVVALALLPSIVFAAALLAGTALLATVPAAWRAMRVDPVAGLRAE